MDPHLLRVKQETIRILRNRGYEPELRSGNSDIEKTAEDRLLMVTLENIQFTEALISWARGDQNSIRARLLKSDRNSNRSMLCQTYVHTQRPHDKCLVYFAENGDQKTVPLVEIRFFVSLSLEQQCRSAILVSKTPLSTEASKEISSIRVPRERTPLNIADSISSFSDCFIQTFLDDELTYTPEDHIYVPKHRIMEVQEAADFLSQNRLKLSQLPQIAIDDPVVKRLGALPGEIIEIRRENLIPDTFLDQELCYRVVYLKAPEKKK